MTDQYSIRQLAEQQIAAFNARDVEDYLSRIDESYEGHSETAPAPILGHDGVRTYLEGLFRAFPDLHIEIEQIIASEGAAAVRMRGTGTHRGNFAGIAPTGKTFVLHACNVLEIRNGKVIRGRLYADNASLFQHLGILSLPKTMAAG